MSDLNKMQFVVLTPMTEEHVPVVVDAHLESFPGFFLTFLGRDFLTLLYNGILSDPSGLALVACSDNKVIGFVTGVMHQSGFYQRLIKRQKWAFAVAALGALLRRPTIAPRLLRALRRPANAKQASAEACLMSIAVRPESQGEGVGKQLVEAFCQELVRQGAYAVCLTTDRDNNDVVNHFYQELGFRLSRSFVTPEGRAMNEYVINIDEKGC